MNRRKRRIVEDLKLKANMSVVELVNAMRGMGGFQAAQLVRAIDILVSMLKDEKCTTILAFPACIIATGLRGAIVEMLKRDYFDVIITTCGTLDHDIARSFSSYFHGDFNADDYALLKEGIHRLGNVFIPFEAYGMTIENAMKELINFLARKRKVAYYLIIREIAKIIEKSPRKEESIIWWAYKKDIPIIVPGPLDGSFGYNLWIAYQNQGISIDVFADESLLSDIIWESEKLGALIIGGGISKHHTIWWAQFKGGLQYAVYITTAVELDGSLSGAQTREAVSWKKISEKAQHVTVWAEATIVLPLIVAYLISVIEKRKRPPIVRRILAEKLT